MSSFYLKSTQIDRIYETTVGTTENVKEGNEQIREVRCWLLLFLLFVYCSSLFLCHKLIMQLIMLTANMQFMNLFIFKVQCSSDTCD